MPKDRQASTMTLGEKTLWLSTDDDQGDDAGHQEIEALLGQPELIPAGWEQHLLVFARARDHDASGDPCVLSLTREGNQWIKRFHYLGGDDWLPSDRFVHVSPAP